MKPDQLTLDRQTPELFPLNRKDNSYFPSGCGTIIIRQRSVIVNMGLGLFILTQIVAQARSAPPAALHLFPAGGQRGTKLVVTCTGTFSWPPKVFAPGIEVAPTSELGQLQIEIPGDLPTDRVWIRLYDAEGTATPLPFLIGGLREISEQEPNDRPREAILLNEPGNSVPHRAAETAGLNSSSAAREVDVLETAVAITINGALKDEDVDCFGVQLAAGQTLVAAVDAFARLGSPMDAILQVVSREGTVLAEKHDDLNLDPRLAFTATKPGIYVVRLFAFPASPDSSIRFAGGANQIYRLTLTTGPFVTHSIPLSAPLANPGQVEAAGWNFAAPKKLSVVPLGGTRLLGYPEYEVLDDLRRAASAQWGFASSPEFPCGTRIRLTPLLVMSNISQDSQAPRTLALRRARSR